jgi:hypothetical protein
MLHRVSVLCLLGKQRDITSYQQPYENATRSVDTTERTLDELPEKTGPSTTVLMRLY